mmetsp:Transcript_104071/g.212351  ORF Transcript_104071/g.212351 Transcript_104071/m.212351 type:complete len:208 (-) Transcript_104071:380-1003(-)
MACRGGDHQQRCGLCCGTAAGCGPCGPPCPAAASATGSPRRWACSCQVPRRGLRDGRSRPSQVRGLGACPRSCGLHHARGVRKSLRTPALHAAGGAHRQERLAQGRAWAGFSRGRGSSAVSRCDTPRWRPRRKRDGGAHPGLEGHARQFLSGAAPHDGQDLRRALDSGRRLLRGSGPGGRRRPTASSSRERRQQQPEQPIPALRSGI